VKDIGHKTVFFEKLLIVIATIISAVVVVTFFVISIFSSTEISTKINETIETAVYHKDIVLVHILVISVVIMLLYQLIKKDLCERLQEKIVLGIVILLTAVCSVIFIFMADIKPGADAFYVLDCAEQILEGDFDSLLPGGYLSLYPHQLGLVAYSMVLTIIADSTNYLLA